MTTREKAPLKVGDRVRIYDRYRFALHLSGEIIEHGYSGFLVKLDDRSHGGADELHPKGVWIDPKQCRRLRKKPSKPVNEIRCEGWGNAYDKTVNPDVLWNTKEEAKINVGSARRTLKMKEIKEGEIILSQSEFENLVREYYGPTPRQVELPEFLKKRLWP